MPQLSGAEATHAWLRFYRDLATPWSGMARNSEQEWQICAEMIANTDPTRDLDLSLAHFAGRVEGAGQVNLSTLHSAKGREFNANGIRRWLSPSAKDNPSGGGLDQVVRRPSHIN